MDISAKTYILKHVETGDDGFIAIAHQNHNGSVTYRVCDGWIDDDEIYFGQTFGFFTCEREARAKLADVIQEFGC